LADTVVVVPCYNEQHRLPAASFKDFLRETPSTALLFVNDGSRDGTLSALRALERVAPSRVEVLDLPENVGKAEAVRRGMLRALAVEPHHAGYWDADLATPLAAVLEFRALLDAHAELDLVMGARVVLLGRRIERSAARHYLGRVAATAIASTLSLPVYDTQCGAKLFRATPRVREVFADPFVSSWAFDVEILARLIAEYRRTGASAATRIVEHPLSEWVDVPGSKVRPRDYLRAGVDLLRIRRRYLRVGSPRSGGAGAPRPPG
jgi:glycosyltransferase involved in cell wall biosynthesis